MPYRNFYKITALVIAAPILLLLIHTHGHDDHRPIFHSSINQNILCLNPEKEFGIVIDSFQVETGHIRWNQNLAEILADYNLGEYSIHQITRKIDAVFDVTKFKAGNRYRFYFEKSDSLNRVIYFLYEHNTKEYVKVRLGENISVEKAERESHLVNRRVEGRIESSLWKTMKQSHVSPTLALELADVYAWSINFFNLKAGDRFQVIYKEEFVDSTSVGINRIETACFTHKGEKFYAIPFVQQGSRDFYDLEGNSLRREFLKAPLRFRRISSGYSLSRMHPILHYRRPHRGVDYAAPTGTPIQSIGDGKVIDKGYTKGAGYYIKIRHNSVYVTGYNHLSAYAEGMHKGVKFKQGQTIGYVGSTGYATGPHLDFRFWKNGHPIDPLKVEAPPVEPIHEANRDSFGMVKKACLHKLNEPFLNECLNFRKIQGLFVYLFHDQYVNCLNLD